MTTYEIIKELCKERGIAVTALEKELGFGRGSIGKLRNGSTTIERLQKIADFFNVSIEYLNSGTTSEPSLTSKDERDIAQDLDNIMAKLSAKYEVLYIIDPAQGEEGIAALVEKFKGIVEAHGTLTSVDEWGKRHLAYPINDLTEGYYVYMTCDVTPDMPAELDRVFKITDGILRSIIVAVEE